MLLYMGNGTEWSAYQRERRVRHLTECAAACGAAADQVHRRLDEVSDGESCGRLALALAAIGDCLEVCAAAASLLARDGELSRLAAGPCVEACRRCAEACDALSPENEAAECARHCRRSMEVCRSWAGL